jgi:MFS family permease
LWRKHLAFLAISYFVFLSNFITASITPILVPIIEEFHVSLTKASYLVTFNILFLGISNLFWIPLSRKIGKRPVLILSSTIFFVSSIWAAVAQSWGSLFGARILQGFSASSSEALGPAVVADVYFLHERGTKVGFYTFMIAGGSALGGIFAGQIENATPNWRWVFWMNVILTGVCSLITILFQAETNFHRPTDHETGEGLESSQLESIRLIAKPSWAQSLSVTSWYNRLVCGALLNGSCLSLAEKLRSGHSGGGRSLHCSTLLWYGVP